MARDESYCSIGLCLIGCIDYRCASLFNDGLTSSTTSGRLRFFKMPNHSRSLSHGSGRVEIILRIEKGSRYLVSFRWALIGMRTARWSIFDQADAVAALHYKVQGARRARIASSTLNLRPALFSYSTARCFLHVQDVALADAAYLVFSYDAHSFDIMSAFVESASLLFMSCAGISSGLALLLLRSSPPERCFTIFDRFIAHDHNQRSYCLILL